ncbi:MAG: 30S ribosomal protein S2 [Verrucomicrobiota bacterium]
MPTVVEELVEAGVHFGHQSKKWNPRMKPYLLLKKGGVHIINVEKTAELLEEAGNFLAKLAENGKQILFVGCKRQAQDAVRAAAEACGQFYVNHRWLGGMMTNMETIKKSIKRLGYLEDIEKSPDYKKMSKKELASLNRERQKLARNLDGMRGLNGLPDALVIVDSAREHIAVNEATKLGIPVVAMVDSNADPLAVQYPIPSNDDAIRSIRIVLQNLIDPVIAATDGGKLVKKKSPRTR